MKRLSAILVSVFCATIVSAAPTSDIKYSITKLNFDDIENEVLFDLNDESEPFLTPLVKRAGEKIKCTVEVAAEALKDNKFIPEWNETKKELEELQKRVKNCMILPTKLAIAVCLGKEAEEARKTLKKFFVTLSDAEGSYIRIKNAIKEKCFSDNSEIMEFDNSSK